jgi:hypothetical protein
MNILFTPIARAVTISMNIPGTTPYTSSTPGAFVANFYQFALMIGGVLAFGVIVYGGVRYTTSFGNPSGQGDAKEWIEAALLGLLLLIGAYFILDFINPQLLNLSLPGITPVNIQTPSTQLTPGGYMSPTGQAINPTGQQTPTNATCSGSNFNPNACPSGQKCVDHETMTNGSPTPNYSCQ